MSILQKYVFSKFGTKGIIGLPTQKDKSDEGLERAKAIILREFEFVDSELMADFIVEAKNFFEQQNSDKGKIYKAFNYAYGIKKLDDNQGLINSALIKTIIIPADREQELDVVIDQDRKDRENFENVNQLDTYIGMVNGIQFIADYGYCLYIDDKISSRLIKFDQRFESLVKRLMEVRLGRPSISMAFAMQLVINELKTGKTITGDELELFDSSDILHNMSLIIKNKLKLYMTPQQQEELRQMKVLERFKYVDSSLLKDFIVDAQSLLTGIEYKSATVAIVQENQSPTSVPEYMEYIVPGDKIQLVNDKWVYYKTGNQRRVYEMILHLSVVNYFNFNSLDHYEMYSLTKGLDHNLIRFNPQFKDVFNDLMGICLTEPEISMEEAFKQAIINLKKRMSSKVRTLAEVKKG